MYGWNPLVLLEWNSLSLPQPPCTIPVANPKSGGRVLTSHENLNMLMEKEEAKKKAQMEQEVKKRAQETKWREKEVGKASGKGTFI